MVLTNSRRYAVLHHTEIGHPHFDLVFEFDPDALALTTFRCQRWPIEIGDELEEIADHRRAYLVYEGPISGGRGSVSRVDEGHIQPAELAIDPPTLGLRFHSMRDGSAQDITLMHRFDNTNSTSCWSVISSSADEKSA